MTTTAPAPDKLYLVDASIYVFRSYFSIPSSFVARDGQVVNAVYGYTQFLLDLIDQKPALVSVAFDESLVSCYRNKIYPAYKANRDLPDANLEFQLARCQEITRLLGFHSLCLHDYEADDIIGTLQQQFGTGRAVMIVTRDKDLGQLLREQDRLWDFAANSLMGPAEIFAKFGVRPDQLADYLALAGDPVDNIPGAPGIGAKTAAALLAAFGSLDNLLENPVAVALLKMRGASKTATTLAENADLVRMFRRITGIHCEVPMQVELSDLQRRPASTPELRLFCETMGFGQRLTDRVAAAAA